MEHIVQHLRKNERITTIRYESSMENPGQHNNFNFLWNEQPSNTSSLRTPPSTSSCPVMSSTSPNCQKEATNRTRTAFTITQLNELEKEFQLHQYVRGPQRTYVAKKLKLSETQIKIWFQNRRIKFKKENKYNSPSSLVDNNYSSGFKELPPDRNHKICHCSNHSGGDRQRRPLNDSHASHHDCFVNTLYQQPINNAMASNSTISTLTGDGYVTNGMNFEWSDEMGRYTKSSYYNSIPGEVDVQPPATNTFGHSPFIPPQLTSSYDGDNLNTISSESDLLEGLIPCLTHDNTPDNTKSSTSLPSSRYSSS